MCFSSSARQLFTARCLCRRDFPSNCLETITTSNFWPQPSDVSFTSYGETQVMSVVLRQLYQLRILQIWSTWTFCTIQVHLLLLPSNYTEGEGGISSGGIVMSEVEGRLMGTMLDSILHCSVASVPNNEPPHCEHSDLHRLTLKKSLEILCQESPYFQAPCDATYPGNDQTPGEVQARE